jgi:small subunit ribosomal protein S2
MSDESEQKDAVLKKDEEELGVGAELLLPLESLLSAGIHIGTRIKTKDMEPFIYRVRPDGLYVLDVKKTDERIRMAAKFIARFEPSKVAVASSRLYGRTPVEKFCQLNHSLPILGRFLPGLFSNPVHSRHIEAEIVIVTDPKADRQAVREAAMIGIPVVALCDTDNDFINVDYVIPSNNKGRRALATMYWLLTRQVLRERGELAADAELSTSIDDFETKLVESAEASEGE